MKVIVGHSPNRYMYTHQRAFNITYIIRLALSLSLLRTMNTFWFLLPVLCIKHKYDDLHNKQAW